MTEEQGTLEETETGTATETQQEPVIQTVKITATGDCTLGATQTHGYACSFHEYYDKYGQDYFFKNVIYYSIDMMTSFYFIKLFFSK